MSIPIRLLSALREADLLNDRAAVPTRFYEFDATYRMVDGHALLFLMGVFTQADGGASRTVCVGVRNAPKPYINVFLGKRAFDPMPLTRATARYPTFRFFQYWKAACAAKHIEREVHGVENALNAAKSKHQPLFEF